MRELFSLFLTFFKIGLFTFGGGYAMIAQIRESIVENKKWLTEDELLHVITISEATPGPIAINMATFIGYKRKGVLGSALATLGVVLPSFIIIFTISLFVEKFLKIEYVAYAFAGINSAVAFLILKTGITMFKKMEKKLLPIICFCIVFGLIIAFEFLSISFSSIYFILIGGAIGVFAYSIFNIYNEESEQKWYI